MTVPVPPSISRRGLLTSGAAAGALSTLHALAGGTASATAASRSRHDDTRAGDLPAQRIGVQMYSLRDQVSELGFAAVLPRMAEIGFREIEFAGIDDGRLSPRQVAKVLADNGLRAIGNHAAMDDASIEAANAVGAPYTGIGFLTNLYGVTSEAWKRTADDLNSFGARSKREGIRFYVHIHGPEYLRVVDDPSAHALDLLLRYTDPELVWWEMDIYWAYFFASYVGGANALFDPADWVVTNRHRFPLFHVKDGRTAVEQQIGEHDLALQWNPFGGAGQLPFADGITDVGQGDIDFHRFFETIGDTRDHHYIWERDTANQAPKGEFTSARASYLMMAHDEMAGLRDW